MLFSNFWTHEDSWYRKLLEERITSSHKSCQSQQQAKDQKIETCCSAPVGGRKDRYLVDAAVCTGNFLLVVAPGHNAVLWWPKFLVVGGWIQFLSLLQTDLLYRMCGSLASALVQFLFWGILFLSRVVSFYHCFRVEERAELAVYHLSSTELHCLLCKYWSSMFSSHIFNFKVWFVFHSSAWNLLPISFCLEKNYLWL